MTFSFLPFILKSEFNEEVYDIYYQPLDYTGKVLSKGGYTTEKAVLLSESDIDNNIVGWKRLVYVKKGENNE